MTLPATTTTDTSSIGREVAEEGALGDAGAGRDLSDARGVEPVTAEQLQGAALEALPGLGALGGSLAPLGHGSSLTTR